MLIKLKKIKQSIGDIFDDIFDSSFIEATYRQEIAHNFGKFLKKIHVKEFILVMLQVSSLQFYLKWTA